jgi:integral membrane protein (TIGR00529 family)
MSHLPTPLSTLFVLAVLGLMAVLIYRKLNVLWVLLIAVGAVLALFLVNPLTYLKALADWHGDFLPKALKLIVLIYLINLLGVMMKEAGREKSLVSGLETAIGDRRVMTAFSPMAMGLLPMPGGALLSASMVEMTLSHHEDGGVKSAVNMWFRHLWELVDPLYPGLILSTQILGVSFAALALANVGAFAAMFIFGAVFLLMKIKPVLPVRTGTRMQGAVRVIAVLAPIALAFIVAFMDEPLKGTAYRWLAGPLQGVGAGIVLAIIVWRLSPRTLLRCAKIAVEPKMLLLVVISLALASAITLSGAVEGMKADFDWIGVPAILVIGILPFLTGYLTGVTMAFVSMTIPIAKVLMEGMPGGLYVGFAVAYVMGFLGVFYSPVHLCLLLSAEKFKTDLGSTYKWMIWPGVCVLLALIAQVLIATWGRWGA